MQTNTTFDELAQARPKRGAGAPARCRSHYAAILELLRKRGPQGVLGSELYARPGLYGRSPRNRISELRRDGHLIEGGAHGASDWFYRLIRDNAGERPREAAEQRESDYMRRVREEETRAMPLFAAVVRR